MVIKYHIIIVSILDINICAKMFKSNHFTGLRKFEYKGNKKKCLVFLFDHVGMKVLKLLMPKIIRII